MHADARRYSLLFVLLTGCAKHYRVEGLVLKTDPAERTILVSHRPIQGYMPAMAMPFRVESKQDFSRLQPGTRVEFTLSVGKNESRATHLKTRESRLDVDVPPPANKLAIGAGVPDFSLTDQSGRPVRLSDFAGRVVAVDFIYTRCPLPDVCPRLSANFAYLARRVAD